MSSPISLPPALRDRLAEFKLPLRNGLVAGAVVAMVSLFLPNTYKSEVRILPADTRSSSGGGGMAAAAAAVGVAIPGQDSSDAAYVDIIKSRWMHKNLVQATYRFRTRSFLFLPWTQHEETLAQFFGTRSMDKAVAKVKNLVTVSRDLKTKLITVTVETPSPELSQQLAQNVTRALEGFVKEKAQTRGGNKAAFTAERLREAQGDYARAEQEFKAFLEVHRNYSTSAEPGIRLTGLRLENSLKLRQQVLTTLTLNYEQALLEEKNDMPILNTLDAGDLPTEKSGPSRFLLVVSALIIVGLATQVMTRKQRPTTA
jgi:uncharacterized protein involved in exopolysaccharide biosynthesis